MHKSKWPRVAIIGGSMAGLTTGLILRDLGCTVDINERQTTALKGRSAGIGLNQTTLRYLSENDPNNSGH